MKHRKVVYFVAGGGMTKIGVSTDIDQRLSNLQTGSPVPLRLTYTVEAAHALERRVYAMLYARRRHGEWFEGEIEEPEAAEIVQFAGENDRQRGVPARLAYERVGVRPRCRCHALPMQWARSTRHRNGGYWRCSIHA